MDNSKTTISRFSFKHKFGTKCHSNYCRAVFMKRFYCFVRKADFFGVLMQVEVERKVFR